MSKRGKSSYKRFERWHPDRAEAVIRKMQDQLEEVWNLADETERERQLREQEAAMREGRIIRKERSS